MRKLLSGFVIVSLLNLALPSTSQAFLFGLIGGALGKTMDSYWAKITAQNSIVMLQKMTTSIATANAHYAMVRELNSGKGFGANLLAQMKGEAAFALRMQTAMMKREFFNPNDPESPLNKGSRWAEKQVATGLDSVVETITFSKKAAKKAADAKESAKDMKPKELAKLQVDLTADTLSQLALMNVQMGDLLRLEYMRFQRDQSLEQQNRDILKIWQDPMAGKKKPKGFLPE